MASRQRPLPKSRDSQRGAKIEGVSICRRVYFYGRRMSEASVRVAIEGFDANAGRGICYFRLFKRAQRARHS